MDLRDDAEFLLQQSRRDRWRAGAIVALIVLAALWGLWQFLRSATPRHIVLASGPPESIAHTWALRYREILAREGVNLELRHTAGAAENAELLADPASGVDAAVLIGGVATPSQAARMVMIAALAYEPIWVFTRADLAIKRLNQLQHRRIAVGAPGEGTRVLVSHLLSVNGLNGMNTELQPLGGFAALRSLQAGESDAAMFSGPASAPYVLQALYDNQLRLSSLARSEAYERRFAFLTHVTLPPGMIDFSLDIPPSQVDLMSTESMLVARAELAAPLVHLLLDAAHEVHGSQGYFEKAREFPNTEPVDLPVSADADRHHRFGPSLLGRTLPFWAATLVERLIVVLLPLLVVIVPLVNLLPQIVRWRVRARIYRWYGELALLERDVAARTGELPTERWLAALDRIQRSAEQLRTPARFASESYTLREHIGLVRRAVLEKAAARARDATTDVA